MDPRDHGRFIHRLFTDIGFIDVDPYDAVQDMSIQYEDHSELHIEFYRDGKLVRRIDGGYADITYRV